MQSKQVTPAEDLRRQWRVIPLAKASLLMVLAMWQTAMIRTLLDLLRAMIKAENRTRERVNTLTRAARVKYVTPLPESSSRRTSPRPETNPEKSRVIPM